MSPALAHNNNELEVSTLPQIYTGAGGVDGGGGPGALSGYEPSDNITYHPARSFDHLSPWTYLAFGILILIGVICASYGLYSYCRPRRIDESYADGFVWNERDSHARRRDRDELTRTWWSWKRPGWERRKSFSSESEKRIWDKDSLERDNEARLSADESFQSPPLPLYSPPQPAHSRHDSTRVDTPVFRYYPTSTNSSPFTSPHLV